MEEFSCCGLFDCGNCQYRQQGSCPGCRQGNAFLGSWGRPPCAIYTCVQSRGLDDCRDCSNQVCALRGSAEAVCPLRAGSEGKEHWVWRIARHLESRGGPCHAHPSVPLKTLMRLRWYCAALERFEEQGLEIISSRELAAKVGVGSAMVRKDFSHLGDMGTPGLGYHVSDLKAQIHAVLERHTCQLAWVGAQWLDNILASFAPAVDLNFRIVAAFDTRPEWIGQRVGPFETRPLSELPVLLVEGSVDGVVLALPEEASRVADLLIGAGVRGILNLTPVTLTPPPNVNVRHVDLIGEMMALAQEVSAAGTEGPVSGESRGDREIWTGAV